MGRRKIAVENVLPIIPKDKKVYNSFAKVQEEIRKTN